MIKFSNFFHCCIINQIGVFKHFYAIIAISTLIGVLLDFSGIDPIKALLWSAVINGVVAVPLMLALMHMATRPKVMRSFTIGNYVKYLGWAATLVMAIAAATLGFMTFFK